MSDCKSISTLQLSPLIYLICEQIPINATLGQPVPTPMYTPLPVVHSSDSIDLTRSLILAVSVCYHARLYDREKFEEQIAQQFTAPLAISGGARQFRNEIKW